MIVVYSGIYDSDFYFIDLAFGLEFFKVGFWEIFLDSPSEIKLFSAEVYLLFSLSLKGEGWGEGCNCMRVIRSIISIFIISYS